MDAAEEKKQSHFQQAVISEIRMLLDYVASEPTLTIGDLRVLQTDAAEPALNLGGILLRLDQIEDRAQSGQMLGSGDRSFLHLVRDALVGKTKPASGLTVAYTTLVIGNLRGKESASRATMAETAYPTLVGPARRQRFMIRLFLAVALMLTLVAVWESAKAALGRSLLQNLNALRAEQTALAAEKAKLEAAHDLTGTIDAATLQPELYALCNRPQVLAALIARRGGEVLTVYDGGAPEGSAAATRQLVLAPLGLADPPERLKVYNSSAEREVCERDRVLAFKFAIVHEELKRYRDNWGAMVGSVFAPLGYGVAMVEQNFAAPAGPQKGADDVEYIIQPTLRVLGNYLLPVTFGVLGSLIFVLMDFYKKVKAFELHPRDTKQGPVRIVLGVVTGACIGLFYSAGDPDTAGGAGLVANITLSASGLAFLAGFGVEAVFTALDALVRKVFQAAK